MVGIITQINKPINRTMTKRVLYCIIIFLAILSITLGYLLIINYLTSGWGAPVIQTVKLEIIEGNQKETLYIKFRAWGLAGNHEEIVISPYRDSLKNPKTDYIIYGLTQLYLDNSHEKVELIIPQDNISEPNTKYTNFVIKQYADVSDLTRRYKNNQLIKIDLFDEQNSILIIQKN